MKRNKFLKVLSCVLGCFAICGLSLFSILGNKMEEQKVDADSYVNVYQLSGVKEVNYNSYNNLPTIFYSTYVLSYNKVFSADINYYVFNFDFTFYLRYQKNNNNYYIYDNSYLAKFNTVWSSSRFQDIAPENSSIYFDIQYVRGSLDNLDNYYLEFGANLNLNGVNLLDGAFINRFRCHIYLDTGATVSNSQFATDLRYVGTPLRFFEDNFSPRVSDYDLGYGQGYQEGYTEGYTNGYSSGNEIGYNSGYSVGYNDALLVSQPQIENAYQNGYSAGYQEGQSQDSTVASIFSGILTVGMLPVNFFLQIFNFEILGINLSAFISAIFTVALTIIVIKTVTGKGGGGDDK